jgi:RNA-binding protein YhbY
LVVESAVEKEVLEELQQVFGAQIVEGVGNVFAVFDESHKNSG